ncbi:hypothetical protein QJU96_09915 [Pasteurella skyensis]|uniref:Uncharacterized protein n=1 Tax=Phocoenobacter skyensis TaxID=97481 RepID=A0AAJ6NFF7_9PAST|nr:hypothetical protein [Pasteurella skyensis]MDP8171597.1 hypothetical protein [Pasteurella skyensis]MDP8175843.1 hypothetical protein [Pasteurella skyensis]
MYYVSSVVYLIAFILFIGLILGCLIPNRFFHKNKGNKFALISVIIIEIVCFFQLNRAGFILDKSEFDYFLNDYYFPTLLTINSLFLAILVWILMKKQQYKLAFYLSYITFILLSFFVYNHFYNYMNHGQGG